jgi:hypothetical protein
VEGLVLLGGALEATTGGAVDVGGASGVAGAEGGCELDVVVGVVLVPSTLADNDCWADLSSASP